MDSHLLNYISPLDYHIKNLSNTVKNVYLSPPPKGLDKEFNELFTTDAIEFLVELIIHFENGMDNLYNNRRVRKSQLRSNFKIPTFAKSNFDNDDWKVAPVCGRLKNRHLDLGDVSPSDLNHFVSALNANVQGIQVDFDDGHCPTWYNQIYGMHNVLMAINNKLLNVPAISDAPILIFRPRAWNMIEHNMSVNGKEVPGPLIDFGLIMFHNGKKLHRLKCGPYFYLSKLENHNEAKLWNDIFVWSENKLKIPHGTIKACVLIENILSAFEIDQILYELRYHSLGLNCGIWDYAASIIAKFGNNKAFILPDRNKYVNMNQQFLKYYMQLVIMTCHKRGAHATGGMAAQVLLDNDNFDINKKIINTIYNAKIEEIKDGIDGFLVYDVRLVMAINRLWQQYGGPYDNQITYVGRNKNITENDLLSLPQGGVTTRGLKHNISVTILFINNWLNGKGHFIYRGAVEDSATAEISRSQIWQWIQHNAKLEDDNAIVTRQLVSHYTELFLNDIMNNGEFNCDIIKNITVAADLFLHLVNCRYNPEFITTFISNSYPFRKLHAHL